MSFFIHYADPGFPDPPWPGERRLGPFNTLAEAQAQAVSNSASGYGDAIGIWDDAGSDQMRQEPDGEGNVQPLEVPAAAVAAPVIAEAGAALAAEWAEDQRLQFQSDTLARSGAPLEEIAANQAELKQRLDDRAAADAEAMREAGAT